MREYPIIIKNNKAEKVNITFPTPSLISHHALQRLNRVMERSVNELWKSIRTIKDSFITAYIESFTSDKVIYYIVFGYLDSTSKIIQADVKYEILTNALLINLEPEEVKKFNSFKETEE